MDSLDSLDSLTTASTTQHTILPALPLDSSSNSISLPRASRRPPVPLSRLELLPTEIHIEIIKRAAVLTDSQGEFVGYDTLCKLARASPIFTKLAQAQLYRTVVLQDERVAREWRASAATIRGEFAVRVLQLGSRYEEQDRISSGTWGEVLALQTSDLEELELFGIKGVRSSSLNKLSGLRTLSLHDSVLVDDGSEIVVPFRLRDFSVFESSLPPHHLLAIVELSSASITKLDLEFEQGFDWSPLTSLPSLAFLHLEQLILFGDEISPLAFLSRCGSLKELWLYRFTSTLPHPLSQLCKELASLPNPTLLKCDIDLRHVVWDGSVVTLRELEELIEVPSLANLERLKLVLPPGMGFADVEILRGIKGGKGKLGVVVVVMMG